MARVAPTSPDHTDVVGTLLAKLQLRDAVSGREADVLRTAVAEVKQFPAGHLLVDEGVPLTRSLLLVDGFVARTKALAPDVRQITEIHVSGDFVDLHGFMLKRLDHCVEAMTPVRIAEVPHTALREVTENEPHLGRLLWLLTLIDAAIQRERILSIGRRTAVARIAHLICELQLRLEHVGLTDGESFALPITQIDIADATGLTSVHVNRMLRQLRDQALMTFRGGVVHVHDRSGLAAIAGFDPDYLQLAATPR